MRAKARALGYTLSHDRLQRIVRKRHEKQVVVCIRVISLDYLSKRSVSAILTYSLTFFRF